jgi:hypothetical protein
MGVFQLVPRPELAVLVEAVEHRI